MYLHGSGQDINDIVDPCEPEASVLKILRLSSACASSNEEKLSSAKDLWIQPFPFNIDGARRGSFAAFCVEFAALTSAQNFVKQDSNIFQRLVELLCKVSRRNAKELPENV